MTLMVTNSILNILSGIWSWFIGMLPAPSVPDWFTAADSGLHQLAQALGSVSAWIPVGLIGLVLATWATAWAAGAFIKIARIVLSFLTMGGGSAA